MEKTIAELAVEERRRYQKAWRAKNRDKVRAANEKYWADKARRRLEEQSRAAQAAESEAME